MKIQERIKLFEKQNNYTPKQAYEICPRFDTCNINRCPLSQEYEALKNDSSDFAIVHKQKCVPKRLRKEIGTYFKLKNFGLKPREFSYLSPINSEVGIGIPTLINQDKIKGDKQETLQNFNTIQANTGGSNA